MTHCSANWNRQAVDQLLANVPVHHLKARPSGARLVKRSDVEVCARLALAKKTKADGPDDVGWKFLEENFAVVVSMVMTFLSSSFDKRFAFDRFSIPKRNGGRRMLANFGFLNGIMLAAINRALRRHYDCLLYGPSVLPRLYSSCPAIADAIAEAVGGGLTGWVKSDVTDAFGSINHEMLMHIASRLMPRADDVQLLRAVIEQNYAVEPDRGDRPGVGMPQGNPVSGFSLEVCLSPLLFTLHLRFQAKLILYVDDFLGLTRSSWDAARLRTEFLAGLTSLGFHQSADKTKLGDVRHRPIDFLGFRFQGRDDSVHRGRFIVERKPAPSRVDELLEEIAESVDNDTLRQASIREILERLTALFVGYAAYFEKAKNVGIAKRVDSTLQRAVRQAASFFYIPADRSRRDLPYLDKSVLREWVLPSLCALWFNRGDGSIESLRKRAGGSASGSDSSDGTAKKRGRGSKSDDHDDENDAIWTETLALHQFISGQRASAKLIRLGLALMHGPVRERRSKKSRRTDRSNSRPKGERVSVTY